MAKTGESKQKKMNARVDFTPMVDMIMLLVTFFMLCTTLIKPQTMQIAMPSDKEDIKDENRSQVAESKAFTMLLAEDNVIYYFEGKPDFTGASLKKTTYGKEGIRAALLLKNEEAQKLVQNLRKEFELKKSSDPNTDKKNKEEFKKRLDEIKNSDATPSVIIKAKDKATYENLVDALDEMNICNIGKYVIDNFSDADQQMIDGYKAAHGE